MRFGEKLKTYGVSQLSSCVRPPFQTVLRNWFSVSTATNTLQSTKYIDNYLKPRDSAAREVVTHFSEMPRGPMRGCIYGAE